MKVAKKIKDLDGWTGRAALYQCDPPMEEHSWDDEEVASHEWVIASAAYAMFSGPETYLFPSNEKGEVVDWGELPGSFKGDLSHAMAFDNAGYQLEGDEHERI